MSGRRLARPGVHGRLLCVLLALAAVCSCEIRPHAGPAAQRRMSRFFLEVEDGDTIVYRGTTMRFLGVDAPEVRNPAHGFYEDQPYGRKAMEFTRSELKRAKRVSYASDGLDRYGRLLVHVFVDGYPLSLKLVEEGLGYETVSAFGDNGFAEISDRILLASRLRGTPPFEQPYVWRRTHGAR